MTLYINGTRVKENTGLMVFRPSTAVGLSGQFDIIETEEELKNFKKREPILLSNLETVRENCTNSYIVGSKSNTIYATPNTELVLFKTEVPQPVYRLQYKKYIREEGTYTDANDVFEMSLPQILYMINEPELHNEEWQDYDEDDWLEGLIEFTDYELVEDDPIRYE